MGSDKTLKAEIYNGVGQNIEIYMTVYNGSVKTSWDEVYDWDGINIQAPVATNGTPNSRKLVKHSFTAD